MITFYKGPTRFFTYIDTKSNEIDYIRIMTKRILWDYQWNVRFKRNEPMKCYSHYNTTDRRLIMPINALEPIVEHLEFNNIKVEIKEEIPVTPRSIDIEMVSGFTPRPEQVEVINYLTSPQPYRKGLSTATGSGKTVSSIASIVKLKQAAMIIVSGLTDQWYKSIKQFTNISDDNLYLIQGYKTIENLYLNNHKPYIFICSLETLRNYVSRLSNYEDLPLYEQFLIDFGIGIKIMDEVHLNFHADTQIDLRSNVLNNIYLTATFTSSNASTKKVFNMIYPKSMQYIGNMNKYIVVICAEYTSEIREKFCVRARGYMHTKYEEQILRSKGRVEWFFTRIIQVLVDKYYFHKRNPGEKLLIFFSTLDMIKTAVEWLKYIYSHKPDLKIASYNAGDDPSVLVNNDIIVSTPKKAGTGMDCKNLRTVINTVSMKSPTLTEQMRGRLRKLPNGATPYYIELCDTNLVIHCKQARSRMYLHCNKVLLYDKIQL